MRPSATLLVLSSILVLASACRKDSDGDGFRSNVDCDDENDSVFPDALEICDGIDNNCDNLIDEGLDSTWYADIDGDGYGDITNSTEACAQPDDHVEDDSDCDDTRDDVYPGADETDCSDPTDYNCDGSVGYEDNDGDLVAACEDCDDSDAGRSPELDEICDGIDNNCDELVDYEAVDADTWWMDYDGDGYGTDSEDYSLLECEQPEGYVDNSDDCNDGDATAYLGAEEICDGIDNDCDTEVDEPGATGAYTWYTDVDGDGYGDDATEEISCDIIEDRVDLGGDCDDTLIDVNPGATEVCNSGFDDDCDESDYRCSMDLNDAHARVMGIEADDELGYAVAGMGDYDADGYADVAIGGWTAEDTEPDAGVVYVLQGPVSAGAFVADSVGGGGAGDPEGFAITGAAEGDRFGRALAGLGDADGDGQPDLFVGALYADITKNNGGAGYLFSSAQMDGNALSASDAAVIFTPESNSDTLGCFVAAAGDHDADGLADMLLGSYGDDDTGANSGAVYLLLGSSSASGEVEVADAQAKLTGAVEGDKAGQAMDGAGDMDGDGDGEVVVGVYLSDPEAGSNAGSAYLLAGPLTGTIDLGDSDAVMPGAVANDRLGQAVRGMGDVDGDTYDDVMVNATLDSTGAENAGAVYVLMGSTTFGAAYDGQDPGSVAGVTFLGEASEQLGTALDAGEDLDGDGQPDVALGAYRSGVSGEGITYVFLGPVSGTLTTADADAVLQGDDNSDGAGFSLSMAGDVFGTGAETALLVGAPEDDENGTASGSAFLLNGIGG